MRIRQNGITGSPQENTRGESIEVSFSLPLGVKGTQFRLELKRVAKPWASSTTMQTLLFLVDDMNQEHKKECGPNHLMLPMGIAPQPTRAKAGLEGPSPSTAVGSK